MNNTLKSIRPFLQGWPGRVSVAILVVTAVLKWQSTLMPENTFIPPYSVPPVNAKDYFMQATTLTTDSIHWIAPNNYRPAVPSPGTTMPVVPYRQLSLAQKDDIIRKNSAAFAKIEEGLKYPYVDPIPRTFASTFAHIAKFRGLARDLRAASEVRAAHGDWDSAAKYDLDAMQLGSDLTHGPIISEALTGFEIERIGRLDLSPSVDHLNMRQSLNDLTRLNTIIKGRATASEITLSEENFTQGSLLNQFHDGNWKKDMMSFGYIDPQGNPGHWVSAIELLGEIVLRLESPRTAYNNYSKYVSNLVLVADEPWPKYALRPQPNLPSDPINSILLPASNWIFYQYACDTGDKLLELSIALHAYKLQHGSYPSSLNALMPTYLSAIPTDPFTSGQPFKYSIHPNGYLLYSVGPDMKDDGGKPVPIDLTPGYDPEERILDRNSKGDIVAGVTKL